MAKTPGALRALAVEQGWTVEPTRSGHWRFVPPGPGPIIIDSGTTSDCRATLNLRGRLRRAGLQLPRKDGRTS